MKSRKKMIIIIAAIVAIIGAAITCWNCFYVDPTPLPSDDILINVPGVKSDSEIKLPSVTPIITPSPIVVTTPTPAPTKAPEPVSTVEPTKQPTSTPKPVETPSEPSNYYNGYSYEEYIMAQVLAREDGDGSSKMRQSAVIWCILNRVDAGYGSISQVCKAPNQFAWYSNTIPREDHLVLAHDVYTRWLREHNGETDVGRTLPREYMWFSGNGYINTFRDAYRGGNYWNWSLPNPYDT